MILLLRDYYTINRKRVQKDYWCIFTGLLLIVAGLHAQATPDLLKILSALPIIAAASLVAGAAITLLMHTAMAWSAIFASAHRARTSIRAHINSPDYQAGKNETLNVGPGIPLFKREARKD